MSSYPIKYEKTILEHKGGTKFYQTILLTADNGKTVLVFRWGKVGGFGDILVNTYLTVQEAQRAESAKIRSKTAGGYEIKFGGVSHSDIKNDLELVSTITPGIFAKIGATAIKHLDPGFDTTGMREADPPRLNEDGELTKTANTGRTLQISQDEMLKARLEKEEADRQDALKKIQLEHDRFAKNYEANPIFGRF